MYKIYRNLFLILIVLIWLMPISNQYNVMNEEMIRNCYILNILILLLAIFLEGKLYKKQVVISFSIILILFVSTILTIKFSNDSPVISWGYLLNYIPYCLLLMIKPNKLSNFNFIDRLLQLCSVIVICVAILMVLDNSLVEIFLKTNYINHYPHLYEVMWNAKKTVTFFATHSIACYIYFLMWWMLDYRSKVNKTFFNKVLIVGIIFCIIMCKSTSAVLTTALIFGIYFLRWVKGKSKSGVLKSLMLCIVIMIIIFANYDMIQGIFSSDVNGLAGRYGDAGNLNATISYALSNVIPLGICDISGLWLTDGGYFIHFVRGGLLLVIFFYYGLYVLLRNNIQDKERRNSLFIVLLAFEIGYQFTISMRFFMIMLFLLIYSNWITTLENKNRE